MLVYIVCLLVSSVVAESQPGVVPEMDPPYCAVRYRRLCKGKGKHVACQFPTQGPGESCVNYTLIKFPKDLRHFVTHYINRRRQRLATGNERVRGGAHLPRPEIMMQVEWDRELALLAQRLADQCSFVHDDCRATVRFPYAGQTVGEVRWRRTSESENLNVARAVRRVLDAWWGERRRVTTRQLTQPFRLTNRGNMWGHFSQLAVWTLRAVGCGAVKHGNKYPKILLVCDFSHTNMLGQRTLVPGPLGPCPIHTARQRSQYPTLCAPVRHQETEELLETKSRPHTDCESDYDEGEKKNYDEVGSNNFLLDNTTVYEANEYTLPPEKHKLHTHKQMEIEHWEQSRNEKPVDQESEGNDNSLNTANEKDQNTNQDIEKAFSEDEEPKLKENIYKIKKMRYRMKPSEKTMQEDESAVRQSSDYEKEQKRTGSYKIKRLRDRGKSREKSNNQENIIYPLEHQDVERNDLGKVQDSKNKKTKKIPDIIRNYKPLDNLGKEMTLDRVRLPDRVPIRGESHESERQPEILSEDKVLDKVRPLERDMHRPPEEDTSLDFEPNAPDEIPITREPTTEKQRTRYMLKLGDIQIQQKNFDLKNSRKGGSSRQKEFRRIQENQMDKLNLELAHENYKDSPLEPNKFNRLQPVYVPNKHRLTEFVEYETSSKDLLDGLKTLTTTAEPRRTQFYEPVGLRHRWRPSKDRPERPGARALIENAYMFTTTRPLAPKKHSATSASKSMDKEDMEQLFKDTGFNPNWKQYKKILS